MKKVLLGAAFLGLLMSACVAPVAPAAAPAEAAATEAPAAEAPAAEAPAAEAAPVAFVLADRIAQKVANGEPLVFRVSYHDVSNQFAPFMKLGVEQAAAEFGVDVEMVGPVGPDADAQINELETLAEAGVDGAIVRDVPGNDGE